MKRIIGITGGIASGKSNVASVIEKLGYPVIDCDKISYELSKKNGPLYKAILDKFGPDYLLEDGELNRKKLGVLIFNNSSANNLINDTTHPIIREYLLEEIKKIPDGLVFIEVPLLYEAKFDNICDKVICVFLKKKYQVARLMAREGIDEDYALAKIHSQMDLYLKREKADYVIDSYGSFEETEKEVKNVLEDILKG
jgi:dephospho-CoA kinase